MKHFKISIIIISLLSVLGSSAYAQSIFKSIPKPKAKTTTFGARAMTVSAPSDSTSNVWRVTAVGAYVFPNPSGTTVQAGIGYAKQHLKYDFVNLRWQSQYSYGFYGLAGGAIAPKTPQDVASVAALFGFANDLFRVGPVYHVFRPKGTPPFAVAIVIGANFNN